jgi:hypothetical protein
VIGNSPALKQKHLEEFIMREFGKEWSIRTELGFKDTPSVTLDPPTDEELLEWTHRVTKNKAYSHDLVDDSF